jgi:hypothetical protein
MILQIINERLGGRDEEVKLRQRCLSVLSGFGCTERSQHIFMAYFDNVEYTAICYRALYRYEISYAATELTEVHRIFRAADATGELDLALHILFRDFSNPKQRVEILTLFLKKSEPESFLEVLQSLRGIKALTLDLFLAANHNQRVEFFRLLLQRVRPEDIQDALWMLKSIGIELHCIMSPGDKEYIEGFYEYPETGMGDPERLFPADELSDVLVIGILQSSEIIAITWANTRTEIWGPN